MSEVGVIGIGCRFPPRCHGPEELWDLLCSGSHPSGSVPPDHREADQPDLQLRVLPEVSREAIDDAGIDVRTLDTTPTGVYVDTASSSVSAAVHRGIRALVTGECDLALAGADGYGRGEGCGIVVLRRLLDARRAGERIYAVVSTEAEVEHLETPDGIAGFIEGVLVAHHRSSGRGATNTRVIVRTPVVAPSETVLHDTRPADHALSKDAWSRLAGLDSTGRRRVLIRIMATTFARAIGIHRDALDLERSLSTLGLDPPMLAEVQAELNLMLGTDLSLTERLESSSIRDVAVDLDRRVQALLE